MTQAGSIYDYFQAGDKKEECNSDEQDSYYGLSHTTKASNVTRLWFTNPCGLGVDPLHPKSDSSFSFLKQKSKCDVFGLAETNVHWNLLYNHASLYARVKRRWKSFKLSTSHNKHEKLGKTQRGGTCTVALNQTAFREFDRGQDETGLGRWSWIEFRGKDDHRTRVYTAYRPGGKPMKGKTAHTTVYEQQVRFFRGTDDEKLEPRDIFDRDILKEISDVLDTTNVVLMIDVNQNIMKGLFTKRMREIGMSNIFELLEMLPMPATHHRGRYPISTIYVSAKLNPIRAGILPKTIGVQGDHRNIYVDITNDSFLGVYMYKIISQPMKRLQLRDSRIVSKFQKAMIEHLDQNNMLQQGLKFLEEVEYPSSPEFKLIMEGYDDQLGRAIESGKSKCRKLKVGNIPYSKAFATLRDTRRLWLLILKRKVGQNISSTTIRRLAKKLRVNSPMSYSLQAVKDNFKRAEKEYRSLNRQTALTQRNQFNEELAAANAIQLNTSKEKILKRIIYDEQIREQSRATRRYFPKRNQASQKVDRVQHLVNGQWKEESDPRGVARACQKETEEKYQSTETTPLMKKDLHHLLGNFSETEFSRKYRDNLTELPDETDRWTKEMMNKTRTDISIPRLPIPMTPKEVQQVWKIVKENKASAPSGRYNSVYKAMSTNKYLLQILTISMNLPFLSGYSYRRWHKMVDIMAFKKRNNIKVDNIRSIIISEADWNAAGKVHVTRRLMSQAEEQGLLPQEHMGGRKGRKSTDGVLTKRLILDNSRITNTPMIIISTDAANCYDRMLHKYISFMCIKWGLAVQVMIALLQPLQKATHYTRTAFGDTYAKFTGDNLQGAGQGNTGAAPFWTTISTPVIELMKEYGMQATFTSPLSGAIVVLTLLAFVDDTELFLTARPGESVEDLIVRGEIAINLWREFLYVTGGVMRSAKCSWTLMDYKGTILKSTLLHQNSNPGHIRMPDEDGTINIVPRYDIHERRKYLGVVQTTNGDEKEQELEMMEKVQEWNNIINQSKLPPVLNLKAVMTKIHRSLIYPLPALSMTYGSLQKISNKLYWESLPKCGIVRTFPIRYRHLPQKYQGLGLPNLYLEQEMHKVMNIIQFSNTISVVWKQMTLGIENLQMRLGLRNIIFDYDYYAYDALCPKSWLKSVWKFMHDMKLKFKGWNFNRSNNKRLHDAYIMEEIVLHDITKEELITFNECRLYLQIETISDMANGDGTRISNCYYTGRRDEQRVSTLTWPTINRPNITKWVIWQKWLDRIWCRHRSQHILKKPIGKWTGKPTQIWKWYYDEQRERLYYLSDTITIKIFTPYQHSRSSRNNRNWFIFRKTTRPTPNNLEHITNLSKATVSECRSNRVRFEGWASQILPTLDNARKNKDFIYYLLSEQIPEWMYSRNNFQKFKSISDIKSFIAQPLRAVTDASVTGIKGTACVIIETKDFSQRMIFVTKVPANLDGKHANDSYRSELCGIWATLKMIATMEKITNMATQIQFSCDNLRAIEMAETYNYINVTQQHFDIARATLETRKSITSSICYSHVRGHADKHKKFEDLERMEQLNVLCDKYAKEANSYLEPLGPVHFPEEGLSLWNGKNKVYTSFKYAVQEVYWNGEAARSLKAQFEWNESQFNSVSWQASERAMSMMNSSLQIRISKFVTRTLPVGHVMERRNSWKESFCPRCGCNDESPHHILQCSHKDSRSTMKSAIHKFEKVLIRLHTEHLLQIQLLKHITEWVTIGEIRLTKNSLSPFYQQKTLGWDHFMEGRVHIAFQEYMDKHYESTGSKKTGEIWTAVVIQSLWTHLFTPMWDHRNRAVHAIEMKGKQSREVLNLNFSIRELYQKAKHTQLLFQDRYLLDEPISILLKSPTGRKKGWILSVQIALRESEKAMDAENLQMRNSMQQFRETGSCRKDKNPRIIAPQMMRQQKRSSHQISAHKRRRMESIMQASRKRAYSDEGDKRREPRQRKKAKRNPYRKTKTMYLYRQRKVNILPTILEEWEKENHVKKKHP